MVKIYSAGVVKNLVLLLLAVLGPFIKLHSQNMFGIGAFLFGVMGPWRKEIIENGTRNGLAQGDRKLAEPAPSPVSQWVLFAPFFEHALHTIPQKVYHCQLRR
jgi:hypothetical protein